MTDEYPVPSNGSYICTFADCPDRDENIWGRPSEVLVQRGFCPLGARATDYSRCNNRANIGLLTSQYDTTYCEVACREGVCPRGFTR